jgi:hydrogenase maturation protein HypF
MTSGNVSELPIATSNEESLRSLADVADGFLMHDREIVSRYDDSVVRLIGGTPTFLRRARGYAPLPVPLPIETPVPVLAAGPHLKNTFALAIGSRVFVSQHIGDLENLETLDHFRDSLKRYRELFRIDPGLVACDAHPGYLSTRVAEELAASISDSNGGPLPIVRVQHHHAHIAAVAAEHGEEGPVLGVAYDGTGYGTDGASWGAEMLVADLQTFRRVASLRYAPMPGGDLAARRPWRAAIGFRTLVTGEEDAFAAAFEAVPEAELRLVDRQARRGLNAPLASSMGRLFDAAAAVLGLRTVSRYEGQAAMELESVAWSCVAGPWQPALESGDRIRERISSLGIAELPFPMSEPEPGSELRRLEPGPLLVELGRQRQLGADVAALAAAFHLAVADGTVDTATDIAHREGLNTLALGGGTFQNAMLTPLIRDALRNRGFRVLTPRSLSPNDGAISYGQAAVAAARASTDGR